MAFRKVFVGFYTLEYEVKLRIFGLEALEHRRLKFDRVLCFMLSGVLLIYLKKICSRFLLIGIMIPLFSTRAENVLCE